ncbi:sulfur-oxidizing protein SoxZ [Nitratiruptor sp. YY08-26]|uniref:thiosulfate oxidation carrier complex protein SoxZ n=1 Tax=unclassified Nitratiruptor TaxID=2624044 RepID=UPI001916C9D5|nr:MULTISPECIES: thiosulfate oxidation carrier complex protein SoxZ [unclassified Nitratiruptor]BCD61186.1 sulfur-oxidizing protein SoxZ [Nitratiruptor sp. YY08-13]BCD65119.1 sulfur-oxidizing protein SoxZ [Nitratiruptor sp. YY08-26]
MRKFSWRRGVIKPTTRDYKVGDVVIFQAITIHPMDTGFQKDKHSGQVKPRFFVETLKIFYNDKEVCSFDFEVSSSPNPKVKFPLRIKGPGVVKAIWEDNIGNKFEKSTKISLK